MKWPVIVLAVLMAALFAFYGWYRWDIATNRGYTFGYYGQFNKVGDALSEIPGITVTGRSANEDITLEEFIYNIKTADGNELSLCFAEREPIRKLSGRKLTSALLKKIEEESSRKQISSKQN